MSRAEMKSIGMNENGNDYIMRKIEELTSSQKRTTTRTQLGLEHPVAEKPEIDEPTDSSLEKIPKEKTTKEEQKISKPYSTEIDMSDNIFLAHKNPELIKKRQEELLQLRISRQAIPEEPDEEDLALNEIE